jgi:type II secretory pathway pseudopilin PulG
MHPRQQRGFTYIGLLIFLAILGVASALTVTVGSLLQRRANEAELLFIGAQYAAAFRSFYEATPVGQRQFPARIQDLLRDPRYPGIKRHLRKIYVDPISGSEEWGLVAAPGGGFVGIYSLSKRAPIKIAGFGAQFALLAGKKSYSEWVFGFVPPGGVVPVGKVTQPGAGQEAAAPPEGN